MTPPPQAAAPPTPDEMRIPDGMLDRPRQTAHQVLVNVAGGPGYFDRQVLAVEVVMNEEWWRGYAAALSTTAARYREALATERFEWQPIEVAPRETGVEILGARIMSDKMIREPFISFWSPTLNKFYCDPTHYILMPALPSAAAILAQTTPQETK
jgi:hypothetical protein